MPARYALDTHHIIHHLLPQHALGIVEPVTRRAHTRHWQVAVRVPLQDLVVEAGVVFEHAANDGEARRSHKVLGMGGDLGEHGVVGGNARTEKERCEM